MISNDLIISNNDNDNDNRFSDGFLSLFTIYLLLELKDLEPAEIFTIMSSYTLLYFSLNLK
jgi:hypothetical protein